MRGLTWIGIIALSSANFIGCAEGGANTTGTGGSSSSGSDGGGGSTSTGLVGGASSTSTSSGGAGGAGGAGGGVGGSTGSLTYTGTIIDGFEQTPIDAADVCALDPMLPCVVTDALGAFTYTGVPEQSRVRVGVSKNTYFPIESLIDTSDQDGTLSGFMLTTGLITIAIASGTNNTVSFDENLAAVSVTVTDAQNLTLPGYSISLDPPAGDGPYYIDNGSIVMNGTQTTADGTAFIVNIPFGTYDVNVTGPGACTASFIDDDPNQHTAPLINPAQFVIVFDCQ